VRIEAGTHLANRYRAEVLLGRGGMGEVWRCHDLEQHREVAVKAVRSELLRDAWAGRLFHGEVAAVARLNHPGIVPVYDLVTEPDGTTLGSMFPSLYFAQLTGEKKSGLIGRNSLGLVLPNIMAVFFYMRRNKIWRRSEVRCNAGPWP